MSANDPLADDEFVGAEGADWSDDPIGPEDDESDPAPAPPEDDDPEGIRGPTPDEVQDDTDPAPPEDDDGPEGIRGPTPDEVAPDTGTDEPTDPMADDEFVGPGGADWSDDPISGGELGGGPTAPEGDEPADPMQDDEFVGAEGADWSDDPIGPEDDISENDLTDQPVPTETSFGDMRFAPEGGVTIGGVTYREGEALPSNVRIARDIERQIVERNQNLSPEDVAVGRTDAGFEAAITEQGRAEAFQRRQFRREQAEEQAVAQTAQEFEQRTGIDVGAEDFRYTDTEGVVPTESGLREIAAGDVLGAEAEDFTVEDGQLGFTSEERVEQAAREMPGIEPRDLEVGEGGDIEYSRSFRAERQARQREQAIGDIEQQLEQQYGVELDREDYAIEVRGPAARGSVQQEGETQIYGTLTQEGQETVAVGTAPLREAPVIGGLTTTGARLRQRELQSTDPYAEAFREATPGQADVGEAITGTLPGAGTVASFGTQADEGIEGVTATPRDYTQEQLDALRNATLGATPYVEDPQQDATDGAAAAGVAGLGVTGTAAATGTGTGAAAGTAASAAAGTGAGAAVIGLGGIAAGYARGDVERTIPRETIGEATAPAQAGAFGEINEVDIPDETQVDRGEVGIPEDQFGEEIATPSGTAADFSELDVQEDTGFEPELTPGEETVTEVQLPEQGRSDGQAGQPRQDESVVPGDYPLAGRDQPADPTRDYVPGERVSPTVGASPVLEGEIGQEEQPEISREDILEGLEDPEQPGPSIREQMRREDLYSPEREFYTGEEAVVGRESPEELEELIEAAETPSVYQDPLFGQQPIQAAEIGVGTQQEEVLGQQTEQVLGSVQAQDVQQRPVVEQAQRLQQRQETRQPTETQPEYGFPPEYGYPNEPRYPFETVPPTIDPPNVRPRLPMPSDDDSDEFTPFQEQAGIGEGLYADFRDPLTGGILETERQ